MNKFFKRFFYCQPVEAGLLTLKVRRWSPQPPTGSPLNRLSVLAIHTHIYTGKHCCAEITSGTARGHLLRRQRQRQGARTYGLADIAHPVVVLTTLGFVAARLRVAFQLELQHRYLEQMLHASDATDTHRFKRRRNSNSFEPLFTENPESPCSSRLPLSPLSLSCPIN